MGDNEFDAEYFINGLKELEPVIFFKDTEARYTFSNHYKQSTNYDNGHNWDIYGKTDLECRDDIENAKFVYEFDLQMMKTGQKGKYVIEVPVNGEIRYMKVEKSPIYKNGEVVGIVGLITDITEITLLKKQYEQLANIDELTGLYTNNYFKNWVQNINEESMYPLSIIYADCNYLKSINDTYGHAVGNEYIKMAADLFKQVFEDDCICIRNGGDEFLIILPNKTKEETKYFIRRLTLMSKQKKIMDQELSVSYGVSTIDEYTTCFDKYLEEADKDMYENKRVHHSLRKELN